MAATILITAATKQEESKKQKALQYMSNNLSITEIERLEEMARSQKAREMLTNNWALLKSFI